MKKISFAAWLYVLFFTVVGGMVYVVWRPMKGGELYQKPRYAYLHRVAYEYRDAVRRLDGRPVLLGRSDDRPYSALGLPSSHDQATYVWVVLDDVDEEINSVTVIPPNEAFVLSCKYLADLESRLQLASNTRTFLRSRCSAGTR